MAALITEEEIQKYHRDGAVVVRNVFSREWIKLAAAGIERNLVNPSVYASENQVKEGEGRFFDDYCNWTSIEEFQRIVFDSPAAELAVRPDTPSFAQLIGRLTKLSRQIDPIAHTLLDKPLTLSVTHAVASLATLTAPLAACTRARCDAMAARSMRYTRSIC